MGAFPGRRCSTGREDFPAARTLALLKRASYDRFVSYEWEKRWHPAIEEPEVGAAALPRLGLGAAAAAEGRGRRPAAPGLGVGRLRVEVHADRPAVGAAAAQAVAEEVRGLIQRDGKGGSDLCLGAVSERVPVRAAAGARIDWRG
jgi:hypothetical protein